MPDAAAFLLREKGRKNLLQPINALPDFPFIARLKYGRRISEKTFRRVSYLRGSTVFFAFFGMSPTAGGPKSPATPTVLCFLPPFPFHSNFPGGDARDLSRPSSILRPTRVHRNISQILSSQRVAGAGVDTRPIAFLARLLIFFLRIRGYGKGENGCCSGEKKASPPPLFLLICHNGNLLHVWDIKTLFSPSPYGKHRNARNVLRRRFCSLCLFYPALSLAPAAAEGINLFSNFLSSHFPAAACPRHRLYPGISPSRAPKCIFPHMRD